ncbi:hypothetical protein CGH37_23700 [Vibrio parahaemolyticus]|nr:transposase [Vibrio parahaemolyticus]TOH52247.1 hypothetical protein CGI78_23750 [Vibrio parahaemolyticus]TOO33659.1 hypothetical protein CGH37_23700 [Vibrio parahaemolyticus]TOO48762.1 hypothetical protein CGH36_02650 [Vibrio parahaemolyticus]
MKLSPYSPELNPIEQVWRWLRQRYLTNQFFTDYHDIVSKSAMHSIGFWIAPKESPKCIRKNG